MNFKISGGLKMRDLRTAETSNSAAIDLMARFAVDDNGAPVAYDDFIAHVDELEPMEFYALWARFSAAIVPNGIARH